MYAFIVFCSGALIMILEMTASRVLAPYLGTSIIVWTSLIGVVLAFLALGAFAGGRLADKHLSPKILSLILTAAALSTICTALLHTLVSSFTSQSIPNLHLATVVTATILLAVPGFFFGMVAPYVIRLSLVNIATSGALIGRLYALSTAGSIIGTFLGGFVLISFFGSTQILYGIALAMFLLSILIYSKKSLLKLVIVIPFVSFMLVSEHYGTPLAADGKPRLIETPYNVIVVSQEETGLRPWRTLATDPGAFQSAIYVHDPDTLALAYTRFFALGPYINPKATSVLMLGGGAYSVPRWLLHPDTPLDQKALRVDVVELDPNMTQVAKDRFTLKDDPRMRIIHDDARRFLNRSTKSYDLVFVDVFGSYYNIPFHVGTVEAAQAMRRAVAPGGALIMNVIASVEGEYSLLFQAIYGSLASAFAEVHVFVVNNPKDRHKIQNIMLVALPEARPDLQAAFIREAQITAEEAMTYPAMLGRRVTREIPLQVPPLTDAYAPVERYILPFVTR